jgi:hypothetical protein
MCQTLLWPGHFTSQPPFSHMPAGARGRRHGGQEAQGRGGPVDNHAEISYRWLAVNFVVKLLLKLVVRWINAHPASAFSRFMLKPRGPRTDVARMDRWQRLTSALAFLLWGCLFLGLWLLTAYLTFGLGFLSPNNPVVGVLIFGLALLSGCGLLGGLYLLLRVLV